MHGLVLLAMLLGAGTAEMRLLVKRPVMAVGIVVDDVAVDNGADKKVVRTQVEVALRRCGITISEQPAKSATVVQVTALSQGTRGWAALIEMTVRTSVVLDGQNVLVDVFTDNVLATGTPGSAGTQVRSGLDTMLDSFCNSYLEARQETAAVKHRKSAG